MSEVEDLRHIGAAVMNAHVSNVLGRERGWRLRKIAKALGAR